MSDKQIIERSDLSVRPRIRIELLIAHKTIQTQMAEVNAFAETFERS